MPIVTKALLPRKLNFTKRTYTVLKQQNGINEQFKITFPYVSEDYISVLHFYDNNVVFIREAVDVSSGVSQLIV